LLTGIYFHLFHDTADLLNAIAPRPVTMIAPQDALGGAISEQEFRRAAASRADFLQDLSRE
jgi:hypothetical protein